MDKKQQKDEIQTVGLDDDDKARHSLNTTRYPSSQQNID